MTRVLLFLGLLISNMTLSGQDAELIILSTKGEVTYSPPDGSDAIALIPGLNIPNVGDIYVDESAKVRLIVKQKSVLLTGPGRYKVADIYKANTEKSMSFSARFWNFVTSGMSNTDDKKDLIKYHREYMKVHGGVKGYSEEEKGISLLSPKGGRLYSNEVVFSWTMDQPMSDKMYTFQLFDADRMLLMSKRTSENEITIDLYEITGGGEGQFIWKIRTTGDDDHKSSETHFTYLSNAEDEINEKLLYINDYLEAEESEKQWIRAVVLEMEGYYYEAEKTYENLIQNDQGNLFLKKNFALFLSRQDRMEMAENMLK